MPRNLILLLDGTSNEVKDNLTNAMSLDAAAMAATTLIAPTIGGGLYNIIQPEGVYFLIAVCCILAVVFTSFVKTPSGSKARSSAPVLNDIKSGLAYVIHSRMVLVLLVMGLATSLLAMPFRFLMPVFVVENRTLGNQSYCTINEGLGKVMRFGANDDSVIERLRWIEKTLAPALREAVLRAGGVDLRPIMAQALAMGDEMHQRNVAATSLFFRAIAPHLVRGSSQQSSLSEVTDFLVGNDQFFLNLAMAAAKSAMDAAASVNGSTLITAMSRNGTNFGIRIGALGNRWFTAPSLMPEGLYFPGFTSDNANPDMGDSAILETLGLGAFAMAGSPAVVGFVGAGTYRDALNYTQEMGEITLGHHPHLSIPNLDYQGVPSGIDLRKVVETGISPAINTGIAHKEAGAGQVGAGIARAPLECFHQGLEALVNEMESR